MSACLFHRTFKLHENRDHTYLSPEPSLLLDTQLLNKNMFQNNKLSF